MKREDLDFFTVAEHHDAINKRLENWAAWVKPHLSSPQSPIWRLGRSNSRQWHAPQLSGLTDAIDAQRMEKAVYHLPEQERFAIRWSYVWKFTPGRACRMVGCNHEALLTLVRNGRQMLVNRGA